MKAMAIFSAALLSLTAGAALAQGVGQGDAQLAASAGVQPGLYSTSQLVRLIEAQRANQDNEVNWILANPEGPAAVARGAGSPAAVSTAGRGPGADQLARSAGVEPGRYSTDQLIRLIEAQRENQDDVVRFILANPQG